MIALASGAAMPGMAQTSAAYNGRSEPAAVHNSWSLGAAMPTARQWPEVGVIGKNIYVVGGNTNGGVTGANEIYNTKTNTWTTGAPDPTPRCFGVGAVVKGILYVIGGETNSQQTTNIVESYNPVTDTWTTGLAPMPTSRNSIRAAVDNNIIYVIGGCCGGPRDANVESYDPATNTWTEEAPMFVGKSDSAVGLLGGTIISAGGLANSGLTEDNEGYKVKKNSWATLTPSPNEMGGGCTMTFGGQLYSEAYGSEPNLFQAYSLKTNSWTTGLASLPQPVIVSTSAEVGGRLYCFGGLQNGNPVDYVQIYQP
jgi:N-acetylneuraminic acid mutarotase